MIHGVRHDTAAGIPTILFGAFDRHNLGDLLFPHITAAMLAEKNLLFAGLAARDLRSDGGHQVRALAQLAAELGECPVNIIHVGGELLTCDAWQAAVMLLPPDEAQSTIARLDSHPAQKLDWARRKLGTLSLVPYTLPCQLFPCARVIYNAVGGVDLGDCDAALRAEVLAKLKAADAVSVRDIATRAHLEAAGIAAQLMPDPAVMVAELFGTQIRQRACGGELAQILAAFPQGYVAVQFSADFGDDATLMEMATQLEQAAISTGYGVVFFRAGAAPWHDDLDCYRRAAARMRAGSAAIFSSLDIWDICALVTHSRIYCGSSLHGRIIAMAFALPRINLVHSEQARQPGKQAAFAATWEVAGMPATVKVNEISQGICHALTTDPMRLQQTADGLASHYRQGFKTISTALI